MALKCELCGREFKNDLALKIHKGRQHAGKAKAAAKPAAAKAAPAGGSTCKICGRKFAMPLHLGRHMAATHGKAKAAAPARRPGRPKGSRNAVAVRTPAQASAGLSASVRELTIDQLIALKEAVDVRLAEIVRFMRQAKITV